MARDSDQLWKLKYGKMSLVAWLWGTLGTLRETLYSNVLFLYYVVWKYFDIREWSLIGNLYSPSHAKGVEVGEVTCPSSARVCSFLSSWLCKSPKTHCTSILANVSDKFLSNAFGLIWGVSESIVIKLLFSSTLVSNPWKWSVCWP